MSCQVLENLRHSKEAHKKGLVIPPTCAYESTCVKTEPACLEVNTAAVSLEVTGPDQVDKFYPRLIATARLAQ